MVVTALDIMNALEEWAPLELAEDWDNPGLQVGDPNAVIKKVLVALDVIDGVVEEAKEQNANFIVTHHPMLFSPIKKIQREAGVGGRIFSLIQHGIGVYSSHTNLDVAKGGTNDVLAELLELQNVAILKPTKIYQDKMQGIGRIGDCKTPLPFLQFAKKAKEVFGLDTMRLVGEESRMIKRVALCTGSGMEYASLARSMGAEVYITADIRFHEAQKAWDREIALIDGTHFASEALIVPTLCNYLTQSGTQKGWQLEILPSKVDGQPFKNI